MNTKPKNENTNPPLAGAISSAVELADDHPEDWCDRCGRRNALWFAPNDLWNKYHGEYSILCLNCFAEMAKEHGCDPVWKLEPESLPPNTERQGTLA